MPQISDAKDMFYTVRMLEIALRHSKEKYMFPLFLTFASYVKFFFTVENVPLVKMARKQRWCRYW